MITKKKCILILVLNIVLFILAVPGAVMSMMNHGPAGSFVYYTQDSNLFLGVAAAICAVAAGRALASKEYRIPLWVQTLKYLAVCCIAVTLFVVLFILAPMAESLGGLRWLLFHESMLYQHFLSPVIGLLGFVILEKEPQLKFRITFFALIPTFVYAAVLYPLNIARVVDGPYPFLQVHQMSVGMSIVWFLILLVLSYLLAWLVWICNRKIRKKQRAA